MRKKNFPKKKRQKKTTISGTLMLVLLICCFFLLFSSFGGKYGFFHQVSLESLGPVQTLVHSVTTSVRSVWDNYIELWGLREENRILQEKISEYEKEKREYQKIFEENLLLRGKLQLLEDEDFPSVTATVVGRDPSFWFKTIVVDKGKNDGVLKGMVARTEKGVVGQVIQVSPHYAKILLANAPSSAIDAMVEKSRVRGILKGSRKDDYTLTLNYVLKNAKVKPGDKIVTAGIGGIFPSGILLGTVASIHSKNRGMFQELVVTPSVDFQRLEIVFIQLTEKLSWQEELNNGRPDE